MFKAIDFCLLKSLEKKSEIQEFLKKLRKKRFNQSKYGQVLKKEGSNIGKLAGKQLSDKIILAAVDLARSKISDKITSLKGEKIRRRRRRRRN